MPFIGKKIAFEILDDMMTGKCVRSCRQVWLRNIQYALKTDTNPLKLTKTEHRRMTAKVAEVKNKKKQNVTVGYLSHAQRSRLVSVTQKINKKYLTRNSPPYPANKHCGEKKKGNNGKMYISVADKNNVCRWKLDI